MGTDTVLSEARARIIWGETPLTVREFLVARGVSRAVAEAQVQEYVHERNREIRGIGMRSLLEGVLLTGVAGGVLYWISTWVFPPGGGRVYGLEGRVLSLGMIFLAAIGLYGLWKLAKGIVYVVRPQSEQGSVSEM
jgi:hypothetical protein